ncbi:MAG: DUF4231 domain-containing protein [Aquifex sp.]|nr:MAG: DUF4231 domain-containing protein [Aquifex sp.]
MAIPKFETFEELEDWYLENRLEDQIKWYDSKSVEKQKRYKFIKAGEIIFSGLIPFLVILGQNSSIFYYLTALSGVVTTILAAFNSLGKYHELWLEYRTTAETLKHEKYFYITKAGPYRNLEREEAFILLVERVESLISRENTQWILNIGDIEKEIEKIINKGGKK